MPIVYGPTSLVRWPICLLSIDPPAWLDGPHAYCLWTHLLGQLFLTKLVECIEFSGEDYVILETNGSQLNTDDDMSVWNHHGHRTEINLEILRQLLSASIARVLQNRNYL